MPLVLRLIRTTTLFSVVILNAVSIKSFAEDENKKDAMDFLKALGQQGKKGIDDSKSDIISRYISGPFYDDISRSAYDAIETGVPGKVGYGFLMGYSSGFFLKKVINHLKLNL
jgi:hypothetical protein